MSDDVPRIRALPANPDLEHLKNEAKERLVHLRASAPTTQLAEAQFQLAREYGFPSWRALKDKVGALDEELSGYVGYYRHDPALIKNSYFSVTQSDGRLLVKRTNGAKFELTRQEDGRFLSPGLSTTYSFERDSADHVCALTILSSGHTSHMARIDAKEAKEIDEKHTLAQEEQKRPRTSVMLATEVLNSYVGFYASPFGMAIEVACEDAVLYARATGQQRLPIWAEAVDEFFYPVIPAQIHFLRDAGKITALVLLQGGVEQAMPRVSAEEAAKIGSDVAKRLLEQQQPRQLVSVSPEVSERYAGRYRLTGDRIATISAESGRLYAQITGQPKFEIFPESATKYFFTVVAAQIQFFLDHKRRVSHAVIHQNGQLVPMSRLDDETAVV